MGRVTQPVPGKPWLEVENRAVVISMGDSVVIPRNGGIGEFRSVGCSPGTHGGVIPIINSATIDLDEVKFYVGTIATISILVCD